MFFWKVNLLLFTQDTYVVLGRAVNSDRTNKANSDGALISLQVSSQDDGQLLPGKENSKYQGNIYLFIFIGKEIHTFKFNKLLLFSDPVPTHVFFLDQ